MQASRKVKFPLRYGHVDCAAAGLRSAAAIRGWDYFFPEDGSTTTPKHHTDGAGVPRVPHAYILRGAPLPPGAKPILAEDMTACVATTTMAG